MRRGYDVHISVFRVRRNQPIRIGGEDCITRSWYGAHAEAVQIINCVDRVPFALRADGSANVYELQHELGPADKYGDTGHARNAVRVFGI
jgi:hypothetical protein